MLDYSLKINQCGNNEIIMNIYKNKEIVLSARNKSKIQEEVSCIDLIPFLSEEALEFEISPHNRYKGVNLGIKNKNKKIILKIENTVPYFYIDDEKIKGRYYIDSLDFFEVLKYYGMEDGYVDKI